MKKIRLGVIFGGRSGEHEVSLRSAESILKSIDRSKYDVVPIGITAEGRWLASKSAMTLLPAKEAIQKTLTAGEAITLPAEPAAQGMVDVIFPVLHGTFGEDGTIQGLLELANLPYVGVGAREIAVSVLGNDDPIASVPGEIIPSREFYDYDAKYVNEDSRLLIPAPLAGEKVKDAQQMAISAFKCLECSGMARVDLFLEKSSEKLYVNEINTLPGFTTISMYPKLWEASGIPYSELIDRLIALAIDRHAEKNRLKTKY